jgi:hypothetical protein
MASLAVRKLPLRLGVEQTTEIVVSIDLPAAAQVVELPKDFEEIATCLTIRRKSAAKGTHVDSTLTIERTCHEVSAADYPGFRDHVLSAATHLQEQLAFRAGGPAPAASKGGR